MTNLYFKNSRILPKHKIKNMQGWKELEYDIPEYNEETHRVKKYNFEELEMKVIAHAEIIEIEDPLLDDIETDQDTIITNTKDTTSVLTN